MTYPCGFMDCNKGTALWGIFRVEEAVPVSVGEEIYGKSLYSALNFALVLKLL